MRPLVQKHMPGAMDQFYEHIWKFRRHEEVLSEQRVRRFGRSRQLLHWDTIVIGEFGETYFNKVQSIGQTHARIGLEPRWYIGGYAVVLDHLVRAAVAESQEQQKKTWFGGKKSTTPDGALADSLAAFARPCCSTSSWRSASISKRPERARKEAEEKQSQIRDEAIRRSQQEIVEAFGEAFERLAKNDLTCRVEAEVPPAFEAMKSSLNATIERLADTIRNIKVATDTVSSTSEQIMGGSNNLSSRSESQAAALEETAATTEQMAASIKASAFRQNRPRNLRPARAAARGPARDHRQGGRSDGADRAGLEKRSATSPS